MSQPELMIEHVVKGVAGPGSTGKKQFTCASHTTRMGGPWAHLRTLPLKGECLLNEGYFLRRTVLQSRDPVTSQVSLIFLYMIIDISNDTASYCKGLNRNNSIAFKDQHLE